MATLNENIQSTVNSLKDIKEAIIFKGGYVDETIPVSDYGNIIRNLSFHRQDDIPEIVRGEFIRGPISKFPGSVINDNFCRASSVVYDGSVISVTDYESSVFTFEVTPGETFYLFNNFYLFDDYKPDLTKAIQFHFFSSSAIPVSAGQVNVDVIEPSKQLYSGVITVPEGANYLHVTCRGHITNNNYIYSCGLYTFTETKPYNKKIYLIKNNKLKDEIQYGATSGKAVIIRDKMFVISSNTAILGNFKIPQKYNRVYIRYSTFGDSNTSYAGNYYQFQISKFNYKNTTDTFKDVIYNNGLNLSKVDLIEQFIVNNNNDFESMDASWGCSAQLTGIKFKLDNESELAIEIRHMRDYIIIHDLWIESDEEEDVPKLSLRPLTVTENNTTYLPKSDIEEWDGFNKVTVNYVPKLKELSITEPGTYTIDVEEGIDGYGPISVDVQGGADETYYRDELDKIIENDDLKPSIVTTYASPENMVQYLENINAFANALLNKTFDFNGYSDFSLEICFAIPKWTGSTSTSVYPRIFEGHSTPSSGNYKDLSACIWKESDNYMFEFAVGGSWRIEYESPLSFIIPQNELLTLSIVFSGGDENNVLFYLNNKLQKVWKNTITSKVTIQQMYLFSSSYNTGNNWTNAQCFSYRIYNKTLTEAEILYNHNLDIQKFQQEVNV